MPPSKAERQIMMFLRKNPGASIHDVTYANGRNDYAEVKSMIDSGELEVHGATGHHTLTISDKE